jgi:hypothetical protein
MGGVPQETPRVIADRLELACSSLRIDISIFEMKIEL